MIRKRWTTAVAGAGLAIVVAMPLGAAAGATANTSTRTAPPNEQLLGTYHGGLSRDGFLPNATGISTAGAAHLVPDWTYKAAGVVSAQATIVNGIAYWGDWGGDEHATSPAGENLWTTALGTTEDPDCGPPPVGVASSATVALIGGSEVVITGTGAGGVAELSATSGKILWDTRIAPADGGFVWSSPTLYEGSVYIGISSLGDCPLVPSAVFMLDASTGAVEHEFVTVPPGGCLGAGVWSSPTIDVAEGSLYVSTGNSNCTWHLQNAMLELSASDLSLLGYWQVPKAQQVGDSDWGSTPTLFSADIGGQLVDLVGSSDKNGIFYALRSGDLGAGPLWEYRVAAGGPSPQYGQGAIAPAVWNGTTLYVAGGNTTVGSSSCKGSVDALDPATGQPVWRDCLHGGTVLGALTGVPGLIFATDGADLVALESLNGARLFLFANPDGDSFYAPANVDRGVLYAGNNDGHLYTWHVG